MGNRPSVEPLGCYNISYQSKRTVVGQYNEYKNFTLLDEFGGIPKGTSYDYGVYDFDSKCLLLLDDNHLPLCTTSSVYVDIPWIQFHPKSRPKESGSEILSEYNWESRFARYLEFLMKEGSKSDDKKPFPHKFYFF